MRDVPRTLECLCGHGNRVEGSSKPRTAGNLETRFLVRGTKKKDWTELVEGGEDDDENSEICICVDAGSDLVFVQQSFSGARSHRCWRARAGADLQNPAQ